MYQMIMIEKLKGFLPVQDWTDGKDVPFVSQTISDRIP